MKYIQAGIERRLGIHAPLLDGWILSWPPGRFVEEARALRPETAVISASSMCIDEAIVVGAALRRAGTTTVAVGQHVSHASRLPPPGWGDAVDIPLLGDPEEETPLLLERLLRGEGVEELSRRYERAWAELDAFHVSDPDGLPHPQWDTTELEAYPFPFPGRAGSPTSWGYVLTAWGCPHGCSYCTGVARKTSGSRLRLRNPGGVVDEVEALLARGVQGIVFEDDTLFCEPKHLRGICREIERRGLRFPWIAHARPDELDDAIVKMASRTGAVLLKIGVESGSGRVIERLGKARDGRGWIRRVEGSFESLRDHGVGSVAMFMVGCPDEEIEDVERSVELALKIEADYLQVQIFCAYPDGEQFGGISARGVTATRNQSHYETPAWTPSRIPLAELRRVQMDFYRRFYLRPGFVRRHLGRCWRRYLTPGPDLWHSVSLATQVARLR